MQNKSFINVFDREGQTIWEVLFYEGENFITSVEFSGSKAAYYSAAKFEMS